jgi:peptidyl-prolyl cis-trans isomerase SurA
MIRHHYSIAVFLAINQILGRIFKMKKYLLVSLSVVLSFMINMQTDAETKTSKQQPLDHMVAVVNDIVITQSDLDQAMDNAKKQLATSRTPAPSYETLRKQVLNQLIDKKLQLQLANQNGIAVSEADIDKAIQRIAASNNISTAVLYQKLSQENMSVKEYRKEIHDEILLEEVQQQALGSKILVSPQEVDDFIHSNTWQTNATKEYHLQDILISLPEAPTSEQIAAAKKHADDLLLQLRHGMSFRKAAASESGDANALEGGDLGWRKLPEIPSAFAQALPKVKEKDLMGPVQTPNGFHIIRIAGIRDVTAGKQTLQRKEVEELIFQRKYKQAVQTWLTKLRSEAFINTHLDAYG